MAEGTQGDGSSVLFQTLTPGSTEEPSPCVIQKSRPLSLDITCVLLAVHV